MRGLERAPSSRFGIFARVIRIFRNRDRAGRNHHIHAYPVPISRGKNSSGRTGQSKYISRRHGSFIRHNGTCGNTRIRARPYATQALCFTLPRLRASASNSRASKYLRENIHEARNSAAASCLTPSSDSHKHAIPTRFARNAKQRFPSRDNDTRFSNRLPIQIAIFYTYHICVYPSL